MIFVPLIKTKTNAEPVVIDKTLRLFGEEIIPYLEIKKKLSDKNVINMRLQLSGIPHFEGIVRMKGDNLAQVVESTKMLESDNTIPVISLHGEELTESYHLIVEHIGERKRNKKPLAIRLPQVSEDSTIIDYLYGALDENDFIFIDIGDDPFDSNRSTIEALCKKPHICRIIVISNERPLNLTGEDYEDLGYNELIMNTSLIDSIKSGTFPCDGFGSYCSAKNNLNEGGGATPVYAVFLVYDYATNRFFSIRSDSKDYISTAYASLKNKVQKSNTIFGLITDATPISFACLNEFMNSTQKGIASTYYRIGMINYIEQIKNNLFPDS